MVTSHVLNGLLMKRAELSGKIETVQTELRQLLIDLDSLDTAIRLFDPDIDLTEIRPKPLPARHHAFRGEMGRIVLATLRKAGKPIPAHEIMMHVMASRSLSTADKPMMRTMLKRVLACLRHYRVQGIVRSIPGVGRNVLWEVVP